MSEMTSEYTRRLQERYEEYNNVPKWEKELGEILFDLYVEEYNALAGEPMVQVIRSWKAISSIEKLIFCRVAVKLIRTTIGSQWMT